MAVVHKELDMLFRPPTASAGLPAFLTSAPVKPRNCPRRNRSSRRHFKSGTRCAVRRAITAAELYLADAVPTLHEAAEACGSTASYAAAAAIILEAEDDRLKAAILDGRVNLLAAAKAMRPLADLLAAYRATDSSDRLGFTRAVGTAAIWDELIMPALNSDAGRKEATAT
jgi:hypothetical protein